MGRTFDRKLSIPEQLVMAVLVLVVGGGVYAIAVWAGWSWFVDYGRLTVAPFVLVTALAFWFWRQTRSR